MHVCYQYFVYSFHRLGGCTIKRLVQTAQNMKVLCTYVCTTRDVHMYDVNFSHMMLFCRPLEECERKSSSSVLGTPGIDNRRTLPSIQAK